MNAITFAPPHIRKSSYPDAIIIDLTATPCRGDGRGLGNVFDAMIECPQIGELIALDYLVKPKIFAPAPPDLRGVEVASTGDYQINQLSMRMDTDALVGDVVEHWLRHAQRRRTVMFAVDIAHSVHIVRELVKSGVKAEHLDGSTPQAEREAILARLAPPLRIKGGRRDGGVTAYQLAVRCFRARPLRVSDSTICTKIN
jgi:superfamily II DNA or RNA helicase